VHNPRFLKDTWQSTPTQEGAGVRLRRAFGFHQAPGLDPFLLLDDFRGDNPDEYLPGFPWHPHRGIETITYMLDGQVEHGDSMGNTGVIGPGDVQWMTAGSGIIHQEMPKGDAAGKMGGFQLWANLPAAHKMMPPRYREVPAATIHEVEVDGAHIKVICGTVAGVTGPVRDIVTDPEYLDITLPAGTELRHPTPLGYTAFAYVLSGEGHCAPRSHLATANTLVVYADGDHVHLTAGPTGLRLLLVSGKPISEPIAWQGPIVMNTEEELWLAFAEYRNGTFIKG